MTTHDKPKIPSLCPQCSAAVAEFVSHPHDHGDTEAELHWRYRCEAGHEGEWDGPVAD